MTEQIQILKRLLECISRDLKVLWIAQKVFSMYLGENRRWVPLNNLQPKLYLLVRLIFQCLKLITYRQNIF